jgi:hypothetical protein
MAIMALAEASRSDSMKAHAGETDATAEQRCVDQPAPDGNSLSMSVCEGALLSDRYRVLHRCSGGWLAYDERLDRAVFVEPIAGQGEHPVECARRAAAGDVPPVDAVIAGDAAFLVRAMCLVA